MYVGSVELIGPVGEYKHKNIMRPWTQTPENWTLIIWLDYGESEFTLKDILGCEISKDSKIFYFELIKISWYHFQRNL